MDKVRIGDYEILALSDGTSRLPPSFYPGLDFERHPGVLDRDGMVHIPTGCFLVRGSGATIVVDAGLGPRVLSTGRIVFRWSSPTRDDGMVGKGHPPPTRSTSRPATAARRRRPCCTTASAPSATARTPGFLAAAGGSLARSEGAPDPLPPRWTIRGGRRSPPVAGWLERRTRRTLLQPRA